jgi:diguanylate cyclase (GGDEF)-like protein
MTIFNKAYLRNILLVSLAIGIVLPLYVVLFIFPAVSAMLIENTRDDAIRVAKHLSSLLIADSGGLNDAFSAQELLNEIKEPTEEFELIKMKVFSDSGRVLFSTDPKDIGVINRNEYFSEAVAKGEVYTKIVLKQQKSLEGQTMDWDVVETYVPLIMNGEIRGAFEIYYDITDKKEQLDRLLSRSSIIIFTLAFGLVAVIIVTLTKENRNIAERELAEEKIHYLAHYDVLTGLPNRYLYKELLGHALNSAERNDEKLAILFVDLDDFKQVNDTFGHDVGDLLLQGVASRFGQTLRKSDVLARQGDKEGSTSIARFGGDEFIVLLSDIDGEGDTAKAAHRLLDALSDPFTLGEHQVFIGASIGISLYPQDGADFETLTKNADAAMYRAKSQGTKNFRFHTDN